MSYFEIKSECKLIILLIDNRFIVIIQTRREIFCLDYQNMKKIIASIISIVFVVLFLYLFAFFQIPNSGQHTGYITSVEKSGIIFKTWMAYVKTDPQSSQEGTYCITDSDTLINLQNYEKERLPITVYYSAPIILWKWQCENKSSIINSVSVVSQSTTTIQ